MAYLKVVVKSKIYKSEENSCRTVMPEGNMILLFSTIIGYCCSTAMPEGDMILLFSTIIGYC